jgi:hypothetical protein
MLKLLVIAILLHGFGPSKAKMPEARKNPNYPRSSSESVKRLPEIKVQMVLPGR